MICVCIIINIQLIRMSSSSIRHKNKWTKKMRNMVITRENVNDKLDYYRNTVLHLVARYTMPISMRRAFMRLDDLGANFFVLNRKKEGVLDVLLNRFRRSRNMDDCYCFIKSIKLLIQKYSQSWICDISRYVFYDVHLTRFDDLINCVISSGLGYNRYFTIVAGMTGKGCYTDSYRIETAESVFKLNNCDLRKGIYDIASTIVLDLFIAGNV